MPLDADDALVPPPNFAPEFDATATDTSGPPPSSDAPGPVQEPLRQSGDEQPVEETPGSKATDPPEFDPRYRDEFVGLLYVGQLEETFELFGHTFTIATPSRMEKIQMGLVIKPYQDTISAEIAWQTAMVAGYLLKVDNQDLPEPVLTSVKDTAFSERYQWVANNVRDAVIDELFTKCLELDGKVRATIAAMGKASG